MDGIKIEVTGNIARVIVRPARITAGTVGLPVEFSFDSQWDGLIKTAVFRAGSVCKSAENMVTKTIVPWEILEKPGLVLEIGVYGVNDEGTVAIATIWASIGPIRDAVSPVKDASIDPTLPVWKQLSNAIGDLPGLATNAKDNIVEAINEVHDMLLAALDDVGDSEESNETGGDITDITAESIGALPIGGGKLSGNLNVNDGVTISKTDEGGNIMITPPDGKTVDWWEMDSHDGTTFRIFGHRNESNPNGEGNVFPLMLHDDGSISTGNADKTLERLGAMPATWKPTAEDLGALSNKWITKDAAANGTLADALTISVESADGENNIPKLVAAGATSNIPDNCQFGVRTVEWYSSNNILCRILGVNKSGMPTIWLNHRDESKGTWSGWLQPDMVTEFSDGSRCRLVDDGSLWPAMEWINPPMYPNVEYRTAERWNGKPVYCKVFEIGSADMPASSGSSKRVEIGIEHTNVVRYHCFASYSTNIIGLPYADSSGSSLTVRILGTGVFFTASTNAFSGYTAALTVYYVK